MLNRPILTKDFKRPIKEVPVCPTCKVMPRVWNVSEITRVVSCPSCGFVLHDPYPDIEPDKASTG